MRLVIDIPDEEYMSLQYHVAIGSGVTSNTGECLRNYILEGTIIPKGHGDLIDRNTVQMSAEKFHSLGDLHTAQWVVDNTPTIIKADKGD